MRKQTIELSTTTTSSSLIKQPYAITVARHDFNVHEMRIMTRITQALQKDMVYGKTRSEVQKTLFGDKIVRIPTRLLLPEGNQNYSVIRKALKSLEQKVMTIHNKDQYGSYETHARLIMKSKYYLSNQMVEIQLDRDVLPDYLALASYSKYIVEVSMESSSRYIMRVYQFISHWRDKTKKVVMLDELRDILEVGEKYSRPKDLRKYILEPCMKDLKKRADIWFDIEAPVKAGRSITGYVFKLYNRNNSARHASAHEQNIRDILKSIFGLTNYHLEQLREIVNRAELHPHIYEKIKEIEAQVRKGKVQKVKPYVVRVLQNEFGNMVEENDQVYKLPTSIHRQLQIPEVPPQQPQVSNPAATRSGMASIGEHMANMAQNKTTKDTGV